MLFSYFQPFLDNVSENLQEEIHDKNISYRVEDYDPGDSAEKLPVLSEIQLKDIVYHYPDSDVKIFDHASVTFPVGKSVGIVGSSGGGKTTLINIMLGLLRPESGQILADGVDVQTNYRGWLRNIGYIPQSIYMLDTTIRKNVAFGVPDKDIDDEKVWRALKEAQLDEHVRSLPEGLDTRIGQNGIRFSGGQKQRIGIARALFEDPEVLIFLPLRLSCKESSTSNQAFLNSLYDPFGSPCRGQKPQEEGCNRPTRCSEPLRYKVGGASKPSPGFAGWDRQAVMGISLQLYC